MDKKLLIYLLYILYGYYIFYLLGLIIKLFGKLLKLNIQKKINLDNFNIFTLIYINLN